MHCKFYTVRKNALISEVYRNLNGLSELEKSPCICIMYTYKLYNTYTRSTVLCTQYCIHVSVSADTNQNSELTLTRL